jgi:superfamily I DNA/RNA helicase
VYPPLDDSHQRAGAVKEAINNLLAENYALQDIVVLTPWRKKTSLKDAQLAELIDFPADEETRENAAGRLRRCFSPSSSRVLGVTIKAYKGLESLAVILTDISAPREGEDSGFTPNELYVACTRARYRLIIIPTTSGVEFLKQLNY